VFGSTASNNLSSPAIAGIAVTNSVLSSPGVADGFLPKLAVLDVSNLVAAAIQRIHSGGSIVELLQS
jgi:ribose-phosphate pyrophosphokinase